MSLGETIISPATPDCFWFTTAKYPPRLNFHSSVAGLCQRQDGGRLNRCSALAHPAADGVAPVWRSGVHFQFFTLPLVVAVGTVAAGLAVALAVPVVVPPVLTVVLALRVNPLARSSRGT